MSALRGAVRLWLFWQVPFIRPPHSHEIPWGHHWSTDVQPGEQRILVKRDHFGLGPRRRWERHFDARPLSPGNQISTLPKHCGMELPSRHLICVPRRPTTSVMNYCANEGSQVRFLVSCPVGHTRSPGTLAERCIILPRVSALGRQFAFTGARYKP